EVPRPGSSVPRRLVATEEVMSWLDDGHFIVEGDFLPASVPIGVAQTIGMPGLQDDGTRRAQSFAMVGQAKSNDVRQNRCARAFHDDFAHSAVAERTRSTKCVSEILGGCRLWQGLQCHDDPNSQSRERSSTQPSGARPIETGTGVTLGPSETEPQIFERLR